MLLLSKRVVILHGCVYCDEILFWGGKNKQQNWNILKNISNAKFICFKKKKKLGVRSFSPKHQQQQIFCKSQKKRNKKKRKKIKEEEREQQHKKEGKNPSPKIVPLKGCHGKLQNSVLVLIQNPTFNSEEVANLLCLGSGLWKGWSEQLLRVLIQPCASSVTFSACSSKFTEKIVSAGRTDQMCLLPRDLLHALQCHWRSSKIIYCLYKE